MPLIIPLLFLFVSSVLCCPSIEPKGEVVCYYNGLISASLVDPCKCTLLVLSNTKLDDELLPISHVEISEISKLKEKNPSLRLIASIGGDAVKGETFSRIISSKDGISNFTNGVSTFIKENDLDGVEIDWRWPTQKGGKDKDNLVSLMRNLRQALDNKPHAIERRSVPIGQSIVESLMKHEEETTESALELDDVYTMEDDFLISTTTEMPLDFYDDYELTTTEESTTLDPFYYDDYDYFGLDEIDLLATTTELYTSEEDSLGSDYLALEDGFEYEVTLRPSKEDEIEQSTEPTNQESQPDNNPPTTTNPEFDIAPEIQSDIVDEVRSSIKVSEMMMDSKPLLRRVSGAKKTFRGNIKFKDYYNIKKLSTTTEDFYSPNTKVTSTSEASVGWKIASAQNLKLLTGPVQRPLQKRVGDGKILMLTVADKPQYIVKGYQLKTLSTIVDLFSLPTNNLTVADRDDESFTYHPSRLMGVSDIQNADSLIDLIVSLGVPLDKLIMGVPTTGLQFTLENRTLNTPRSPAVHQPTVLSYRDICAKLSDGNWTVERDEDKTGTYSYLENQWIAFDDQTSVKVKSKYALLRGLAGISIHNIDEDDWQASCDEGVNPILSTVWDTFTQLARTPRRAVLQSLVDDLEATESSPSPSYIRPERDLRTSPFRIVRIVDRTGEIRAVRSNAETEFECSRQGYYRDPSDCSQFYRCVKFDQYIDEYTVFEYSCPVGLVFDDRWEVCAWPSAAPPCDGSSEIFPIPRRKNVCEKEGYFTDPENCRWFFACKDYYGNGTFTQYEFRCPFGLAYDEENAICNWPWLIDSCGETGIDIGNYGGGSTIPVPVGGAQRGKSIDNRNPYKKPDKCIDCGSDNVHIGGEGVYHEEKGIIVSPSYFEKTDKPQFGYQSPSSSNNGGYSKPSSSNSGKQIKQSFNNANPITGYPPPSPQVNENLYSRPSQQKKINRPKQSLPKTRPHGNSGYLPPIQEYNPQQFDRPTSTQKYRPPSTTSRPKPYSVTPPNQAYGRPSPVPVKEYGSYETSQEEERDLYSPPSNILPFDAGSLYIATPAPSSYSYPKPANQFKEGMVEPKYEPPMQESEEKNDESSYSYPSPATSFDPFNKESEPSNLYKPPKEVSSSYNRPTEVEIENTYRAPSSSNSNDNSNEEGYTYSKPSRPFRPRPSYNLPSVDNSDNKNYRPPNKNNYNSPSKSFEPVKESHNRPSNSNGYSYEPPATPFEASPSRDYNSPVNNRPSSSNPKGQYNQGYSYDSPINPFTFDHSSKEQPNYFAPTTEKTNSYKRPTTKRPLSGSNGYAYDSPAKPFNPTPSRYPTTKRPTYNTPSKAPKPFISTPADAYSIPTTSRPKYQGYSYKPPSNPFITKPFKDSTTQRPSHSYGAPSKSPNPSQTSGYSYENPSTPFNYPSASNQPKNTPSKQTYQTTRRPTTEHSYKAPSQSTKPRPSSNFGKDSNNQQTNHFGTGSYTFSGQTTRRPSTGYEYPEPANSFNPTSNNQPTRRPKPSYTTSRPTSKKTTTGYSYTEPANPFNPTFNKKSTIKRPSPSYTTPRTKTSKTTAGYSYPKPANPFKSTSYEQSTPRRPSSSYTTPRTTTRKTSAGYSYPKPSSSFNPTPFEISATRRPSPSYTTSKPISKTTAGYSYSEPSNSFNPTTSNQTAKTRPSYTTSKPIRKTTSGFSYPEPANPFTPSSYKGPTTKRPSTEYTTPGPKNGYSYPEPSNAFNPTYKGSTTRRPSPSYTTTRRTTTGYSYAKPENSFNPTSYKPTSRRPSPSYTTPKPTTKKTTGYSYPKPSNSFNPTSYKPPTTKRPSTSISYAPSSHFGSSPSKQETKQRPSKGYSYEAPSKPFTTSPSQGYSSPSNKQSTNSGYRSPSKPFSKSQSSNSNGNYSPSSSSKTSNYRSQAGNKTSGSSPSYSPSSTQSIKSPKFGKPHQTYSNSGSNLANGHFTSGAKNNNYKNSSKGKSKLSRPKSGSSPALPNYFSGSKQLSSGVRPRKPVTGGPSIVAKLSEGRHLQRFGPGGFRDFDDTLGPEVCERAGLFRHPDSCDKFYECYWDKWIDRFTLHVFDCPVTIVYDSGITACNWPFNGPPCTDNRHS